MTVVIVVVVVKIEQNSRTDREVKENTKPPTAWVIPNRRKPPATRRRVTYDRNK